MLNKKISNDMSKSYLRWTFERSRKYILALTIFSFTFTIFFSCIDILVLSEEPRLVSLILRLFVLISIIISTYAVLKKEIITVYKTICTSIIVCLISFTGVFYQHSIANGFLNADGPTLAIVIFLSIPLVYARHKLYIFIIYLLGITFISLLSEASFLWVFVYIIMAGVTCLSISLYFEDISIKLFLLMKEADRRADTDNLTGVFNRNTMLDYIDDLNKNRDSDEIFILGLIDVDCFKKYNDEYGHTKGDHILKTIAVYLQGFDFDRVYRFGGEEFLVVGKYKKGEFKNDYLQISENLLKQEIEHKTSYVHELLTISAGLASFESDKYKCTSSNELIKMADKLLYEAKENGRNRVSFTCYDK